MSHNNDLCARCNHPASWHRADDSQNIPATDPNLKFRCIGYDCDKQGKPQPPCGCPDFVTAISDDDKSWLSLRIIDGTKYVRLGEVGGVLLARIAKERKPLNFGEIADKIMRQFPLITTTHQPIAALRKELAELLERSVERGTASEREREGK